MNNKTVFGCCAITIQNCLRFAQELKKLWVADNLANSTGPAFLIFTANEDLKFWTISKGHFSTLLNFLFIFLLQSLHKSASKYSSPPESIIKVTKLSTSSRSSVVSNLKASQKLPISHKSATSVTSNSKPAPTIAPSSTEPSKVVEHVQIYNEKQTNVRPLFRSHRQKRVLLENKPPDQLNPQVNPNISSSHLRNFKANKAPKTSYNSPHYKSKPTKVFKMSQDIGSCCAKYILCLFNFIFFVSFQPICRLKKNFSLIFSFRFSDRSCLGSAFGCCSTRIPSFLFSKALTASMSRWVKVKISNSQMQQLKSSSSSDVPTWIHDIIASMLLSYNKT